MKKIITGILLVFVAISVFAIIKKETGKSEAIEQAISTDTKTVVYYFHGTKRCKTCNTIEAYAREAVNQNFAENIDTGKLEIKSINVEYPENEHFVKDFQLSMKTVVIANYVDGQITDWKNLDKVWNLVGNKDEFQNYIISETQKIIEG